MHGIDDHTETCGKHGFPSDKNAWAKSYAEGLISFCTEPQGFLLGRQGRLNPKTCPDALAIEFTRGYKRAAVASAYARNDCSWDSDCGSDRTCRSDTRHVEGESVSVGICQ